MTESERSGLLLAARLLESGMSPADSPAPEVAGGPQLGVYLASRLARIVAGGQEAREIAAALRSAAAAPDAEVRAAA